MVISKSSLIDDPLTNMTHPPTTTINPPPSTAATSDGGHRVYKKKNIYIYNDIL